MPWGEVSGKDPCKGQTRIMREHLNHGLHILSEVGISAEQDANG